jgi:TetR/AcrR family transcriptional repressor of nem operon
MRYPPTHKLATRRRIVEVAARVFRERGVAETGVDEVMRRAGLTHGGFYAHFQNKTELVAEACAAAFDAAVPNFERIAAAPTPAARARLLIDSYLGIRHRDNRGSGCLVVAVGADMARMRGAARAGYARGFSRHLERLAAALRLNDDPVLNQERVTQLMSALAGAMLIARAIDDPVRSAATLQMMRRQLRAQFCGGPRAEPVAAALPEAHRQRHDFLRAF